MSVIVTGTSSASKPNSDKRGDKKDAKKGKE